MIDRDKISKIILERLVLERKIIKEKYNSTKGQIGYFVVDDLLPSDLAMEIANSFPDKSRLTLNKTMREHKYIGVQVNNYEKIIEEIVFAFQSKEIVRFFQSTLETDKLFNDESLYAGGVSLMSKGQFLNPHIDNSHNMTMNKWRAFNLLYYVSPGWKKDFGGNLELWPQGVKSDPICITSKFNRLVVMNTHGLAWHSVNRVEANKDRMCVSNYFFSNSPSKKDQSFNVTTFKGRPEQKIRNAMLFADSKLRTIIRRLTPKDIQSNTTHFYKKSDQ